jgi:hypothetical protein
LGDEHDRSESQCSSFSSNPHQIILLEQIRDLAAELVEPSPI